MLSRILQEFRNAGGPLDFTQLGLRLGVQRSALEGMIEFLVRKQYLREVESEGTQACGCCPVRSACEPMLGVRFWEITEKGLRRLTQLQEGPARPATQY
jgi:DNA-binding IclR family transcriptional regulator